MTSGTGPERRVPPRARRRGLTVRQLDLLDFWSEGYTQSEIAAEIDVTVSTIADHSRNIRRILQARTNTQALAIAVKRGIIRIEDIDDPGEEE
jgi:DNA-binding CsgD family transcriptional regulator